MNGDSKTFTIQQSMEGLYTPRYESYKFNLTGLPFKANRIVADGKEITNFTVNKNKVVEFNFSKNFKHIEIYK